MDNLVIHGEWIGRHVCVVEAANDDLVGIDGVVVDETKNFVVVRTSKGDRRVPKHLTTFRISWDAGDVVISGDDVLASPEERVKRKVKR